MPTYEYVCDACEHTFDELQGYNDAVLTKCPKCGKKKLRRLFGTGAAILFKGSGFYQPDHRSSSDQYDAKADKETAKPAPETTGTRGTNGASATNGTAKTGSESG